MNIPTDDITAAAPGHTATNHRRTSAAATAAIETENLRKSFTVSGMSRAARRAGLRPRSPADPLIARSAHRVLAAFVLAPCSKQ